MSDPTVNGAACAVDLAAAMRRSSGFRARLPSIADGRPLSAPGLESADEAYLRGLAEGQTLAAVGHDVERQALLKLLANAEALKVEPCPQLGELMACAVEQLVLCIIGDFPVDPAWLRERVGEAGAIITDADRDRVLHLNPADVDIIGDTDMGMVVRADAHVPRGGLRISTGDGWVEHGRPVYLDALHRALGAGGTAR